MNSAIIEAICISPEKHTIKQQVARGYLKTDHGFVGDAHAGRGHRQVSILEKSLIARMQSKNPGIRYGMFGENIVLSGLDTTCLQIKDRLRLGPSAIVEVTQIGKKCHNPCAIHAQTGYCIMPQSGIFAKVLHPGEIAQFDCVCVLATRTSCKGKASSLVNSTK